MELEFENYEHLEPVPSIYGFGVALVVFVAFICLRPVVKRYGTPLSVSESNRWKWQNILLSWIHSVIVGVAVLRCFYIYPEIRKDLIAFHNPFSYGVVAFSTGYFFSDFLDIVVNSRLKDLWEVLLHHVGVLSIFVYNIMMCRYIGYTNIALLVEVHSISLHLRKLMQMAGVSFRNPIYRVNTIVNLVMFLGFRMLAIVWVTYGLIWQNERLSLTYTYLLGLTMLAMWIVNVILFWRLLKSDILRNVSPRHHTVENGKHKSSVNADNANENNNKNSRKRQ